MKVVAKNYMTCAPSWLSRVEISQDKAVDAFMTELTQFENPVIQGQNAGAGCTLHQVRSQVGLAGERNSTSNWKFQSLCYRATARRSIWSETIWSKPKQLKSPLVSHLSSQFRRIGVFYKNPDPNRNFYTFWRWVFFAFYFGSHEGSHCLGGLAWFLIDLISGYSCGCFLAYLVKVSKAISQVLKGNGNVARD